MDKDIIISFFIAVVIGGLVALGIYSPQPDITTDSTRTEIATTTKAGPEYLYPNQELTPGDVLTTNAYEVCQSGYSAEVRDVSASLKRKVYERYGIEYPPPEGAYQVDHLLALSLGGSNDITNLWPHSEDPDKGSNEKYQMERYIRSEVCSGRMELPQAQQMILSDWYAVYLSIPTN